MDKRSTLAVRSITGQIVSRMDVLGISRADLARRLGASPAFITKLLSGGNNFTIETLSALARELDAEWAYTLHVPRSAFSYDNLIGPEACLAVAEPAAEYGTKKPNRRHGASGPSGTVPSGARPVLRRG